MENHFVTLLSVDVNFLVTKLINYAEYFFFLSVAITYMYM